MQVGWVKFSVLDPSMVKWEYMYIDIYRPFVFNKGNKEPHKRNDSSSGGHFQHQSELRMSCTTVKILEFLDFFEKIE